MDYRTAIERLIESPELREQMIRVQTEIGRNRQLTELDEDQMRRLTRAQLLAAARIHANVSNGVRGEAPSWPTDAETLACYRRVASQQHAAAAALLLASLKAEAERAERPAAHLPDAVEDE